MKIAIVHDFLTKIGGAEKVLLALCDMYPDAPIYTLLYDEDGTKKYFKDKKIITSSLQKYPAFLRKPRFLLSKFSAATEQFNLSTYDVVISSSNSFAKGIVTKPRTMHICYCHSPMRYAWDWYHEYLKEHNLGFGLIGLLARSVLFRVRIWDRISAERVDCWIANSQNVQDRIKKYYHKESTVIYPPVATESIKKNSEKDDFYIAVSRLEPYKNIELAVEAFNENGKKLKIVGEGSQETHLKALAEKNIEFLGWRTDQEIGRLLGEAKAFIFPGEEDFGITPVEAMAAGTPVIALRKGGLLESVVENRTGLFFDQETSQSLNQAIEKFEKIALSANDCREQAEKFSTESFKRIFQERLEKELASFKENL